MAHLNVEIIYDSRSLENARTGFSQNIVIDLCIDESIPPVAPNAEFLGYSDDVVALEYAYTIFPEFRYIPDYSGTEGILILQSIGLEQRSRRTWRATARYLYNVNTGTGGGRIPDGSNDIALPYTKINFTIGDGTKTIVKSLQSKSLTFHQDLGLIDMPLIAEVIGYQEDGNVAGTEVPDPTLRLQITGYFTPSAVTLSYAMELRDLAAGEQNTGSYNNATYLGRPSGEVSFLAASGGGTVVDIIPITFDFSIARNVTNADDDKFPPLTMLGHDLVDYIFLSDFDPNAQKVIKVPAVRQIHRIRSPEDYTRLKLPV